MRRHRNYILAAITLCLLLGGDRMTCSATDKQSGEEGFIQQDGMFVQYQKLTYKVNDNGEAVITGGAPEIIVYDLQDYMEDLDFTSNSDKSELVIPATIDGYTVVGIADRAFAYRQDIRILKIEEGVRYIGNYAFAGCRHMGTPRIGKGLQAIGEGAFRDTLFRGDWEISVYAYDEFNGFLPDSLMAIGREAFAGCSNLEDIVLPPFADIDPSAFEDTSWQEARDEKFQIRGSCLEKINGNTDQVLEIPYGVTRLERGDTQSARSIMDEISRQTVYEKIIFPDTMVLLGDCCLARLKIKRIEMPDSIKDIQGSAFMYGEVSEIILSEKTEVIGERAFYGVDGFETIRIPSSVRTIEDLAFGECWDLRRITIPGTVESIGEEVFFECKNLMEVIYEEGIQEIGCGYKDTSIRRIQFPESTVSIRAHRSGGFWCTPHLERVYIPAGATDLDDELFSVRAQFLNDGFTVYGQKGSRAEELAIQSGYEFIEVESGDEMP